MTYATMSRAFLINPDLSLVAKGLMAVILAMPQDTPLSLSLLQTMVNDDESKIREAFKELEIYGYCIVRNGMFEVIEEPHTITPHPIGTEHTVDVAMPSQKSRFKRPTLEEVRAYILEKGYTFEADAFFDFYESKGWVVGKSPMKSWQAACRTWQRKMSEMSSQGQLQFGQVLTGDRQRAIAASKKDLW